MDDATDVSAWRPIRIDNVNIQFHYLAVDFDFELRGIRFVADADKARRNVAIHGITFEEAAEVFFDPFAVLADASRNDEARDMR